MQPHSFTRPFRSWTIVVLLMLLFLVACGPAVSGPPAAPSSPMPTEPAPTEPLPTEPPYPPPIPTSLPEWRETVPPTFTLPPVPTLVPTPVVTPIPTVAPPIIPDVVGKQQQPFWIYYWQGNEVWRVDDQGQNRELLLDTYKSLGQWLTAHPMAGTDCCWSGTRVVASPDGGKLALVVVDKDKLTYKGEPFTFSIYVFDVASRNVSLVSEGVQPVWSPDSQRVVFLKERGLWIADLGTDKVTLLIPPQQENQHATPLYWMWSPDGQRLAYRYTEGPSAQPEIWIINLADPSKPYAVPNMPADFYYWCYLWMPDNQHLLCGTYEGRADNPLSLWTIAADTGERAQMTRDFFLTGIQSSPDGKWLALSAVRAYEREEETYDDDLWLVSADGAQLLRITSGPPQDLGAYWSPDGTRLVFLREGLGVVTLSLETGQVASLDVSLPQDSLDNYAIGGIK